MDKSKEQTFGETVSNLYRNALESSTDCGSVATFGKTVNCGLQWKYKTMVMYEQEKVVFTNFYCKRNVMYDGIHTVLLSIY